MKSAHQLGRRGWGTWQCVLINCGTQRRRTKTTTTTTDVLDAPRFFLSFYSFRTSTTIHWQANHVITGPIHKSNKNISHHQISVLQGKEIWALTFIHSYHSHIFPLNKQTSRCWNILKMKGVLRAIVWLREFWLERDDIIRRQLGFCPF